jgi:hypothetical protein
MDRWPALKYDDWKDTLATLHLWTQIVGKIRLRLEPLINHWWNVALYVTPRGLTTSPMPYTGGRWLSIDFDFLGSRLQFRGCDGEVGGFALEPMSVAEFYRRVMVELKALDFDVRIYTVPSEIAHGVRFELDTIHASYDKAYVERFFRVLLQADRLCKEFRAPFLGKASPVHFFWGSFDLAFTRFSGRPAPPHPGGFPAMPDWVTREAYSREEHSVGFWFGAPGMEASFYAYAYPEPPGFAAAKVAPPGYWTDTLREFLLPYESVRTSPDPDRTVLDFFNSTYAAAANLAKWDRGALERAAGCERLFVGGDFVLISIAVFEKDGIVVAVLRVHGGTVDGACAGRPRSCGGRIDFLTAADCESQAHRTGAVCSVGNEAEPGPPAGDGFVTDKTGLLEFAGSDDSTIADKWSECVYERAGRLDVAHVNIDVVKHSTGALRPRRTTIMAACWKSWCRLRP